MKYIPSTKGESKNVERKANIAAIQNIFKDYIFPHFFGVWQHANYPNYG